MINPAQLDFYHENGYLLVKGLLTPEEAAAFRQESHTLIERLSTRKNIDGTWNSVRNAMATAEQTKILHCHDTQFYSAAFSRLLVDERLTGVAADLLNSPNVQLHHNKLFIKPPEKGSPFPMHQDYPFFPHTKTTMLAAILHFDTASLEKGCVRVIPGSHKNGALPHQEEGGWHLPFEQYSLDDAVACPAEPGDVLFFSYFTIHGSGLNTSEEARTTWLVQMRDASDRPTVETHLSRGQGMLLRGIDPDPIS